jgi:hypothetical protein
LEVSKRGVSEILAWTLKCLQELATAVASVVPGKHGKVGLSRNPDKAEMESVVQWLTGINAENGRFQDLAVFHSDSIDTGGGDPNDEAVSFTPQPRMFSTHIHFKDGALVKGTAAITVGDRSAQQILEAEASQLPNTGPACVPLILFHVSARGLLQFRADGGRYFSDVGNETIEIDDGEVVPDTLCDDNLQQVCLQYEHRNRVPLVESKSAVTLSSLLPLLQCDSMPTRTGYSLSQQVGDVISSLSIR